VAQPTISPEGAGTLATTDEMEVVKVEVVTRDATRPIYVAAQSWLYDIISNSDLVFQHIGERHERRRRTADYELDRA